MKEAKAYRQGNFLVVENCPFCGDMHTHTIHTTHNTHNADSSESLSDDTVDFGPRVPNCPNNENKGEEYRLVLEAWSTKRKRESKLWNGNDNDKTEKEAFLYK